MIWRKPALLALATKAGDRALCMLPGARRRLAGCDTSRFNEGRERRARSLTPASVGGDHGWQEA